MVFFFLRLEKVDIRKLPSQAKIIGTIVTVSGAMVMTIYRGPVVNIFGVHAANHGATATTAAASSGAHWILGTVLVLGSCLGWAGFFILQVSQIRNPFFLQVERRTAILQSINSSYLLIVLKFGL